ncbi:hypothetical protein HNQ56_003022 [Anaerotaenia torta]
MARSCRGACQCGNTPQEWGRNGFRKKRQRTKKMEDTHER